MGSMVMSTFMMFVPRHVVFLFLAICCIGFFGIYIPYQESKKRGEVWGPLKWLKAKKPVRKRKNSEFDHISAIGPSTRRRLDQLESLKSAGIISEQEYKERRREMERELEETIQEKNWTTELP